MHVSVPQPARRVLEQIWVPLTRSTSPCGAQTDASCRGLGLSRHSHGHFWAACPVLLADPSSQPLPQRWHRIAAASCFLISKVCRDVLLQGWSLRTYCFLMRSASPSWNCSSASEQFLFPVDIAGLVFHEHMVIRVFKAKRNYGSSVTGYWDHRVLPSSHIESGSSLTKT